MNKSLYFNNEQHSLQVQNNTSGKILPLLLSLSLLSAAPPTDKTRSHFELQVD